MNNTIWNYQEALQLNPGLALGFDVGDHGRRRRGSVAPSYSQAVTDRSKDAGKQRFKKPLEKTIKASNTEILRRNRTHE